MNLFRFSGYCSRGDYIDVWMAVSLLQALVVLGVLSGWMRFPADGRQVLSLEYLPLLLQAGLPAAVCLWALTAASIRRCRDSNCPVPLFVVPLVMLLTAGTLVFFQVGSSLLLQQAVLSAAVMSGVFLCFLCIGLILGSDISLGDRPGEDGFRHMQGEQRHRLYAATRAARNRMA